MALIISVILLFLFPLNIISQNWQTTGGNNQKNGLSKITGPVSVNTAYWTVNSSNSSLWGNSVYTYNDKFITARVTFSPFYKSKVELRNINTGAFIWEKQINDSSIMYAIGFTEDAVYAHDYKTGILYALNISDGSVKWSTPSYMFPGNTGLLYACDGDPIDKGRRINKNTGIAKWTNNYIIPVGPDGGFCLFGNTYYHWTGSITTPKQLIAIDVNTGVTKYLSASLPGDGDQENDLCVGPGGTIYICRDGGALYAFQDNGSAFIQLWSRTPGAIVKGVGKDGTLYASNCNDPSQISNSTTIRLDPANGNFLDSTILCTQLAYFAAGNDSTIIIGTGEASNGRYIAFTPNILTIKWQLSAPYNYYSGPSLSRDGIFIAIGTGTEIKAYKTTGSFKPVADFRASRTTLIQNVDTMTLFDQSSFTPTSWSWSIPGSNTPTSTQQNPSNISYSTPGTYAVTLIASNSLGNDTLIKSCYINVIPFISVKGISRELPDKFKLFQNYPNPFNPETHLRFEIPGGSQRGLELSFINIKIFDVLGREVVTLVNEELKPGAYEVIWDGSIYPSGIYFYTFETNGFSDTKKMLLIK